MRKTVINSTLMVTLEFAENARGYVSIIEPLYIYIKKKKKKKKREEMEKKRKNEKRKKEREKEKKKKRKRKTTWTSRFWVISITKRISCSPEKIKKKIWELIILHIKNPCSNNI